MAQHYGLTVSDVFDMSWRRFTVLFSAIFNWDDDDESEKPDFSGSVPPPVPTPKLRSSKSQHDQAVHEAFGADSRISRSLDWDKALGKPPPASRTVITTDQFIASMRKKNG